MNIGKKWCLTILVVMLAFGTKAQQLISGTYTEEELSQVLIPLSKWQPFPSLEDRSAWQEADQDLLQHYLEFANENLDYEWPYIPATKSLLIDRTGDRNEYQAITFEKRRVLGSMILAEIAENEGRFIDPIINGIWSICEESFWGVPAHLPKTEEYSGLMDVSKPFVDLFVAETATYLAWADYFLGEKFDEISPQIRKRIRYETNKRVFEPLMNQHHGWMAANENGRPPNNWNPWICSNWINTALLLEDDEEKRAALVYKAMEVLDEFLTPYPEDGGCDEGPSYWGAAAASLFDNISLLNLATDGSFQYVYEDQKVKNMGKFIYRAQISEDYFLNFADADPQPDMAASMIYRYGKAIADPDMMRFGAFYREEDAASLPRFHYFRKFFELFMQEEFRQAEKGLPLPKDVWLPDTQVMVARDTEGSTDGFFFAAKGGHNDESHNHNDIGNYVVFYDGLPLLIDVGRGTYTRKTFSDERYTIWYNRSDYHNLPSINGHAQSPGSQYRASNLSYDARQNRSTLEMDISKAYPENAGIESWNRTLRLDRGKRVTVTDQYQMSNSGSLTQHLMTVYPAVVVSPGKIRIPFKNTAGEERPFLVSYDPDKMDVTVEKIALTEPEDQGVRQKWGDRIYRINLEHKNPEQNGEIEFEISRE
ncbi:heparinase II/III domain-containing protein [Cyclobacterium jeungdonense]|uniref:Heparinase II/III family protein n=1 Tax=Cyclobacterium jeungdonense TaxID=708087 RepID=A0ABT8C6L9_9BACT|nr:heparinase II/III family protein [Cyclobacterium jeungdonense]MDN3687375.1 heparinase II/III family protein [Cyclobacterium jeungdonense]